VHSLADSAIPLSGSAPEYPRLAHKAGNVEVNKPETGKPVKSADQLTLQLKKLIRLLSKLLNLKVELQMNQLKYPYHDSSILSKLIAFNTIDTRFRNIMSIILRRAKVITKPLKVYTSLKDPELSPLSPCAPADALCALMRTESKRALPLSAVRPHSSATMRLAHSADKLEAGSG
jgi:hypothetical protein